MKERMFPAPNSFLREFQRSTRLSIAAFTLRITNGAESLWREIIKSNTLPAAAATCTRPSINGSPSFIGVRCFLNTRLPSHFCHGLSYLFLFALQAIVLTKPEGDANLDLAMAPLRNTLYIRDRAIDILTSANTLAWLLHDKEEADGASAGGSATDSADTTDVPGTGPGNSHEDEQMSDGPTRSGNGDVAAQAREDGGALDFSGPYDVAEMYHADAADVSSVCSEDWAVLHDPERRDSMAEGGKEAPAAPDVPDGLLLGEEVAPAVDISASASSATSGPRSVGNGVSPVHFKGGREDALGDGAVSGEVDEDDRGPPHSLTPALEALNLSFVGVPTLAPESAGGSGGGSGGESGSGVARGGRRRLDIMDVAGVEKRVWDERGLRPARTAAVPPPFTPAEKQGTVGVGSGNDVGQMSNSPASSLLDDAGLGQRQVWQGPGAPPATPPEWWPTEMPNGDRSDGRPADVVADAGAGQGMAAGGEVTEAPPCGPRDEARRPSLGAALLPMELAEPSKSSTGKATELMHLEGAMETERAPPAAMTVAVAGGGSYEDMELVDNQQAN